ncbi:hypothetical protein F5Y12DRAFT_688581 [Xylaria sp. FL1777]|nr:hypothetical protein F5Y12DRAFT_688581 [Xylaria sp. FL1777]
MAPIGPTPTPSKVVMDGSNGEAVTPATQPIPRSRSWRNKFQKHMSSWKRHNSGWAHAENASSGTPVAGHDSTNSTARSARILSELRSGRNNTPSSPIGVTSLQSESLDSLTSASLFSRNSYPSVISTGTDATSISGVTTACGLTCSIESPFVKPYKRLKNNLIVYLARDDMELPLDAVEQWETTDLDRLKTDLSEVVMEIYRKGIDRESRRRRSALYIPSWHHEYDISFELRMSGRATRDAQQVAIGPSIWLICGSTWACKEINAAMREITWPTLPVEIHEGRVPVPSTAKGKVDMQKLDLTDGWHLGDGIMLYIHVEDSLMDASSCGLLCCATIKDGDNYLHSFSRIGGLVMATNTLKSSQFGVSTAHGMLDHPWWHRQLQKRSLGTTWDCQSVESTDDSDEDGLDGDILYDSEEGWSDELPVTRDINLHSPFLLEDNEYGEGYRDPQLVSRWRNVSHHGLLSFLGASVATGNGLQLYDDIGAQTDHAMIQLECLQDTNSRSWNNKYHPIGAPSDGSLDITTHMSNKDLTQGVVSIICEANSPVNGYLLPVSTCLAMGGRMFTLRKLKTTTPLARGISGSWVARGTELCGMVIAVSNPEPYVYMVRAEDLISNLGTSSPSTETIEVFSSHSRNVKTEQDRIVPQRSSSRKSQHRLEMTIPSSRVSIDKQRPTTSIKRSLSERIKGLSNSSQSHGLHEKSGTKPRRARSVYSRLSDTFSNKVEEIIQPAHRDGTDTKRISEVRRSTTASSRTLGYRPVQARRRPLPKNRRRLRAPLEPIPEVLPVVVGRTDSIVDHKYAFLQSTAYAPTTMFQHGPVRLHRSDLMSRRESTADVDRDCSEYEIALSKTVHHWSSSNYESQQEQNFDEVQDLIDWWESWDIESPNLITEQAGEPLSPTNTASDDFPGVSYSDTTSEDSTSSCHVWANHQDSASEAGVPQISYGYQLKDIERSSADALYEGVVSRVSLGGLRALTGFGGNSDELYAVDCIHGIIMA